MPSLATPTHSTRVPVTCRRLAPPFSAAGYHADVAGASPSEPSRGNTPASLHPEQPVWAADGCSSPGRCGRSAAHPTSASISTVRSRGESGHGPPRAGKRRRRMGQAVRWRPAPSLHRPTPRFAQFPASRHILTTHSARAAHAALRWPGLTHRRKHHGRREVELGDSLIPR